jgi:hypothetical protein
VERVALENAAAIASLLLTIEALITDIPEDKPAAAPGDAARGDVAGLGPRARDLEGERRATDSMKDESRASALAMAPPLSRLSRTGGRRRHRSRCTLWPRRFGHVGSPEG